MKKNILLDDDDVALKILSDINNVKEIKAEGIGYRFEYNDLTFRIVLSRTEYWFYETYDYQLMWNDEFLNVTKRNLKQLFFSIDFRYRNKNRLEMITKKGELKRKLNLIK